MIDLSRYSQALTADDRGIWRARGGAPVSYPAGGHDACHAVEDASFWFQHRNRCIEAAVARHPPDGPIFDVGGGNGCVARALEQAGWEVVLVEPGAAGAAHARARGIAHVVCATLDAAGFVPGSLPAVGLFDVVEHIEDDAGFLQRLAARLVPGGWLYLTVPAYPCLWSSEDVEAGHFRRYTRATLAAVVARAGYALAYATMIFRPLPLPIALLRALPYRLRLRRGPGSADVLAREHAADGGMAGALAARVLAPEPGCIAKGRTMAFGASILMVARRKDAAVASSVTQVRRH